MQKNNKNKKTINEVLDQSVFEIHDTLNPDIFDEEKKMLPQVRKALLKIAEDAYEYLGVDWVKYTDIILTGSQANYNWSKQSDIDLHVLLPYSGISENSQLVDEFLYAKKSLWNNEHDVKIFGYNVEFYVENSEDKNLVAGGIYSVLNDIWLRMPQKISPKFNKDRIGKIVSYFEGKLKALQNRCSGGDSYGLYDDISALDNDLRKLRRAGLSGGGEFSDENLAFKALRRDGFSDLLSQLQNDLYNNSMSLDKSADQKLRDDEPMFGDKRDEIPELPKQKKDPIEQGLGRFKIRGKRFSSLRQAEKVLGIPKSTIEYRLKSDNPEFSDYVELDI